jgi:hypothetical protein
MPIFGRNLVHFSILYAKWETMQGGALPRTVNREHAETRDPRFPANSLPPSHGWEKKKHWMTPRHPVLTKEEVRIPAARVSREFLNSWETDSSDGFLERASTRDP